MTRANVVLEYPGVKIWLYRHCDGYPSGLGQELKDAMDPDSSLDTVLNILTISDIELTTGQHGDIEYLYIVDLENNKVRIGDL